MSVKNTHSKGPIIPAILASKKDYFDKELAFARKVGSVHLDVIDGEFCTGMALPIEKWPDKIDVAYAEAHLMVKEPLDYLEKLSEKGIARAIVHLESHFDLIVLRNRARELDILLGFAVSPTTDLIEIKPILDTNAYIQLMGVEPGATGQPMIDQTPLGVSYVRKTTSRQVLISVDGGVTRDNIQKLHQNGADYFIASHAIFGGGDFQENYDQLVALVAQKEANDD
jgi:ribulose-phosphate 3-epimerase